MLVTKVQYLLHKNLSKIKTNPLWLCFSPRSFTHNFWSFCCCFTSIQLKNITVTSLDHLTRKLLKVTNQHMMTCFCTQTICTSFLVILLLFSINTIKKYMYLKYSTVCTITCQKWKPTQDGLRFLPKSFIHNFRSFCYCFPSVRLKNITVKSLGHLVRKFAKVKNQHMMTSFCTQTICAWFSVIFIVVFHQYC